MRTPEQIAAAIARPHFEGYPGDKLPSDLAWRHLDNSLHQVATEAASTMRKQIVEALAQPGPIPGIRAYRLATVDELLEAAEAHGDFHDPEFIDAWNAYTAGEDFPCPNAQNGLHVVTDGSCDLCGDKNREDYARE